jgi:hypothetical protein
MSSALNCGRSIIINWLTCWPIAEVSIGIAGGGGGVLVGGVLPQLVSATSAIANKIVIFIEEFFIV